MPRLLVLDAETKPGEPWLGQLESRSADSGIAVRRVASLDALESLLSTGADDVLLLHAGEAPAPQMELLAELRAQHPELRALIVVGMDETSPSALHALVSSPTVDFVRAPADVREVQERVRRLAGVGGAAAEPRSRLPGRKPAGLTRHLVPDLRSRKGRLDAKKVAALFGIPVAEVARILGRPLSPVHKTPDAESLQKGLAIFERIAAALLPLAGCADGLRMWLNAANPDLADQVPIELVKRGEGQVVLALLEDALVGQPG